MKKWECTVCGYIHEGEEPPEKCPVCGAVKEKFIEHKTSETVLSEPKQETPGLFEKITALVLDNHLHPISVHGPNGIVPVAVVFLILALIVESSTLFNAAYFNLIAVLLSMPVVLTAGYLTWQNKYNGAKTSLFKMKIAASSLATIILIGLVTWRTVQPDVLTVESSDRYLFLGWSLLLLATVGIAGHLGGKLVFGSKK